MNKTFYRLGSGSLLLMLLGSRQPQSLAQGLAYQPHGQTEPKGASKFTKISVREALNSLRQHYKVDILFSDPAVENLAVPQSTIRLTRSLEQNLEAVLSPSGLRYRKSADGAYLITPATRKEKQSPAQSAASRSAVVEPVEQNSLADQTVTGKVTQANGQPLSGVTVVVKGTTQGTSTDANGSFSLTAPAGSEKLPLAS